MWLDGEYKECIKHQILKRRWKDNIKMDHMEVGCENGRWMELAQGLGISRAGPLDYAIRVFVC
jgi:hypothetical protein